MIYFKRNIQSKKNILHELHTSEAMLVSVLLELPVPVVEGTDLSGLEPAGDAVEVEGVVTHAPGHRALLAGGARLEARKIIH